jgi:SSS family transporter
MSANLIYLTIVILFMAGLLVVGVIISKGIETSEDWMVAGKSLGVIPMAGTYFATIVSAASIISYMGYYYLNGWSGWWNCCGTFLTSFLACIYFAKRLRQTGHNTLPEYIGSRFGEKHAIFASLLIVVCSTALLSAQVVGGVVILQTFVDWNEVTCSILLLVVFLTFTAIGGMKAVAWTDTICSFIIIIGVWIMAVKFLGEVGGFTAMNHQIAAINPDFIKPFSAKIPPITALSWVITWGICNFGAPHFIARFFSAETPEIASRSQGLTGIGLLLFYVPLVIIGLCGMIMVPGIENQDKVFTNLVVNQLNPIFGGIMFAAVVSAIISTADSLLLLAASTFSNDIYIKVKKNVSDKEQLKVSRIATIVIGIGSVILVFFIEDAIQFIQAKAVTLMGSAMAMLTMVGVAWKRANRAGATACMTVGLGTAIIWYALGQPFGVMAALPSIAASLVALVVVSSMTSPPPKEVIEEFFPESAD